ncbi:hypothetical protein GCM10011416_01540 [Polaribacter pacificus]|uniref:Uncharacterized protein n=1 Tax=Polaribacter pacificus TaxID=1775173 RepID=A0A917MA75_9FLAO|nr:hypothetical protein GCM10011416_01540 [Polaribacter pacificus]
MAGWKNRSLHHERRVKLRLITVTLYKKHYLYKDNNILYSKEYKTYKYDFYRMVNRFFSDPTGPFFGHLENLY